MSVFIINAFSAYLSIIFYLSIREGDLCHSGVIAGDLERGHKGEPSLRDCHYETVPEEPPAVPSPGKGHPVPIPLRQGHGTDTPQVLPPPPPPRSVFQQIVSTGSWEDGTRVCTALASSCLGRGGRVPGCSAGAMDRRRAGTPPAAHTVLGHHVPITKLPRSPQHSSACWTGRFGGGCLVPQRFFLQCAQCQVENFTLPDPSSLWYHQVKC